MPHRKSIIHIEGIAEKTEFRLGAWQGRDGKDVEPVLGVTKTMVGEVRLRGPDEALLLLETDRIFGRFVVAAGFDLDKHKNITVPGDHVDFAALDAITGSDDAIAEGAKMIDREDLRTAAECKDAVEKKRKWHTLSHRGDCVRQCFGSEFGLLSIDDERRREPDC